VNATSSKNTPKKKATSSDNDASSVTNAASTSIVHDKGKESLNQPDQRNNISVDVIVPARKRARMTSVNVPSLSTIHDVS
jgi:hypothetical protein